jgi:hypothetical protein
MITVASGRFGEHFEAPLLVQALLMIVAQLFLLWKCVLHKRLTSSHGSPVVRLAGGNLLWNGGVPHVEFFPRRLPLA